MLKQRNRVEKKKKKKKKPRPAREGKPCGSAGCSGGGRAEVDRPRDLLLPIRVRRLLRRC
jgi:hypothetical protein